MLRCRKLNRLAGYDYSSPGAYFITICTKNREVCFGGIKNGVMVFNKYGEIVKNRWLWLFKQYHFLKIDEFCVMPDHFHGIIWISPPVGYGRDRTLRVVKIKPIPELIGAFKTTASKMIHLSGNPSFQWQKSYYDRIIRNNDELNRIRKYIIHNPQNLT